MVATLERYSRYNSLYSQYLLDTKGPLVSRESELSSTYKDYAIGVREQRLKYPLSPKYDLDVSGFSSTSLSLSDIVRSILNEDYVFVGTRRIPNSYSSELYSRERDTIYNDVNLINDAFISGDSFFYNSPNLSSDSSDIHWEFVNKQGLSDPASIGTWKFLYVPVSKRLAVALSSKLPRTLTWDSTIPTSYLAYPDYLYLIPVSANEWPFTSSLISDGLSSPSTGSMVFTGQVVSQADGSILYEYSDTDQAYGALYSLYMSPARPLGLDFPLGLPKSGDLVYDSCLVDLIGYYPSKGYLPYVGAFTGYVTTSEYSPYTTYYLYERADGSTFLLEYPPHSYARDYISIAIELHRPDLGLGLSLYPGLASEELYINDRSLCGLYLYLSTKSCIPKQAIGLLNNLYNNCNFIGDVMGLDSFVPRVGDEYLVDESSILNDGICEEQLDSPYRDLLEDCLVNEVNVINNSFPMEDCISD